MSKTAHTQGPWVVTPRKWGDDLTIPGQCMIWQAGNERPDSGKIAIAHIQYNGDANAALIAASPRLLAALEVHSRHIQELDRLTRSIDLTIHPDARNLVAALVSVIRLAMTDDTEARAAIAAAKGEQ